jgi:hypothetical protein
MTQDQAARPGEPRNERELLDAYFDGQLDRAGKGALHEALRKDAVLAEEFSRTSEAVSMLRQDSSNAGLGVDLADRVLARCDVRSRYMSKRGRKFVFAGRTAVALAALVMVAGVVLWVRLTPPEFRLAEHERPLSVLLEGSNADAAQLRLIPPGVQQDLADSVDPSKVDRTIVFDLPADSARSFSPMGRGLGDASGRAVASSATARLPLLARSSTDESRPLMASQAGPMPMAGMQAASIIRGDNQQPAPVMGWWGRSGTPQDLNARIIRMPSGHSVLLLQRPTQSAADAARDDGQRGPE